jgi:hypothetical protein
LREIATSAQYAAIAAIVPRVTINGGFQAEGDGSGFTGCAAASGQERYAIRVFLSGGDDPGGQMDQLAAATASLRSDLRQAGFGPFSRDLSDRRYLAAYRSGVQVDVTDIENALDPVPPPDGVNMIVESPCRAIAPDLVPYLQGKLP